MPRTARALALLLSLCFALSAQAAQVKVNWTGDAELDKAFLLNNQGKYAEAFAMFSDLYKKDVPMAGAMVGRYYEDGRSVPEDKSKARALYKEALDKGEAFGSYHYYRLKQPFYLAHEEGNKALAAALEKDAEKGNAPIQAVLSNVYVKLDQPQRARYWLQKAADAGYAPSIYGLARSLRQRSPNEAREMMQRPPTSGTRPQSPR